MWWWRLRGGFVFLPIIIKGVEEKNPSVLKFVILAGDSSQKMIYIQFYCQSYEYAKGLAIIQDFTAH